MEDNQRLKPRQTYRQFDILQRDTKEDKFRNEKNPVKKVYVSLAKHNFVTEYKKKRVQEQVYNHKWH